MLQPYEIHDSDISCDTTSVLTTPFSVKDILSMNLNNENEYCNGNLKKEHYATHSQFWDNNVFTTEYNYCCNNGNDNRHYWTGDNVYIETYSQQYNHNAQQNESPIRLPVKDEGYMQTESPSKSTENHLVF